MSVGRRSRSRISRHRCRGGFRLSTLLLRFLLLNRLLLNGRWGCSLRGRSLRRFAVRTVHSKDDLANLDLVALFDPNLLHRSAHRRWHFDHRLVSFQFHDRLAGADTGPWRDHQAHEVALLDVFSQLGKLEFNHQVVPFLDLIFAPQRLKARSIMLLPTAPPKGAP